MKVGWTEVSLGDLALKMQDGPFGSNLKSAHYVDRGIRVVRLQNIGIGRFLDADSAYISDDHFDALKKHECLPGDVLMATLGDPILRACILPSSIPVALNKADCVQFRCDKTRVLPEYLVGFLNSSTGQRLVAALAHGQTRSAIAELDVLSRSIFVDMFDLGSRSPVDLGEEDGGHRKGWTWSLLLEEARLATGHTPDRKRPDYWNGDIPWLSLTDIRRLDGRITTVTSEYVTQEGIDHSSSVRLPEGTVCFSRTASVGFVTIMGREMSTSQDFVNWVCGSRLDPLYLMHAFLNSRTRLRALSSGSTHKTIYFPTVEKFRILLPPISLQREFANRVRKVGEVKNASEGSLLNHDSLFASLQHCAFRGEI